MNDNNYNFKLVTTESSMESNPGDPKTNQIYTETIQRIDNLLVRRRKDDIIRRVIVNHSSSKDDDDEEKTSELIQDDKDDDDNNNNNNNNNCPSCVHVHFPKESARLITDQELQVPIMGSNDNKLPTTPIHSTKYLESMKEHSEMAKLMIQEWKETQPQPPQQQQQQQQQKGKKNKKKKDDNYSSSSQPRPPLLRVGDSAYVDGDNTEIAARMSAAALVDVAKEIWYNRKRNNNRSAAAFVLTKPPSHHVVGNTEFARYPEELREGNENSNSPFGFCHLNTTATAVGHLLNLPPENEIPAASRICILDIDVHHGNGNEDTFWYDSRVLTISLHEEDLWPGPQNGRAEYTGDETMAPDSNLNVPIPSKSGDVRYMTIMEKIVFPKIQDFQPQIIFVATGFDAMKGDQYANQRLTAEWYGWCMQELRKRFVEDSMIPLVLNLEGGYKPINVENGISRCIDALLPTVKYNFGLEEDDVEEEVEKREEMEQPGRPQKIGNGNKREGDTMTTNDASLLLKLREQRSERRNMIAKEIIMAGMADNQEDGDKQQDQEDLTTKELMNSLAANLKIE